MSFIMYISNHTKIRHLYISTFNYGRKEIVFLNGLRQSGKLDRVTLMTAKMFAMSSKSGGLERLRQFTAQVFEQNKWTILYNDNHSKLVLLDTDDGCFVIETSCNFSESSCNEYFSIAKSQELFDFYQSWIESWNEKTEEVLFMPKVQKSDWLSPEQLMQVEAWVRDGLTDEQIAHNIGIGRTTLYRWRKDTPELDAAFRRGKAVVDIEVENALFRRASGYNVVETRVEYECGIEIKRVETTRHIPPDTGAACFWLKNRRSDIWHEKQAVAIETPEPITITLSEELEQYCG